MSSITFNIFGRVIHRQTRQGTANLRVEAWDKELMFNDLVGNAITDDQGAFHIEFTETHYRECFQDR
jgi:hypothetical protein